MTHTVFETPPSEIKTATGTKGGRVIQPDLVNGAYPMMPSMSVTCNGIMTQKKNDKRE